MFKIQTLNKISSIGLEKLPRESYEIASEIINPDAILLRSFNMHEMEIPESVKAIGRAGAGVNNIPTEKCTDKGIVVFNTPGANANAVKELVIAALLLSSRKIIEGVNWTASLIDKGDEIPKLVEKGKSNFAGQEIKGKTLGIIGLGAIGVMVANDALALGMNVIGYDPYISVKNAWDLNSTVKASNGIDTLLAESDYITIHVPLLDKTRGFLNSEKFSLMKDGIKILNFARGGLVNNNDLKVAIANGKVSTYVTDFADEELLSMDNVLCIPHLGASTYEAEDNCAIMASEQVKNFLETGNIKNSVNFPECELPFKSNHRLIIANRNVPKMISQMTSLIADQGLNISDMINKHKGELAYNIIDVDNEITDEMLEKIKSIEGIVMARAYKNMSPRLDEE